MNCGESGRGRQPIAPMTVPQGSRHWGWDEGPELLGVAEGQKGSSSIPGISAGLRAVEEATAFFPRSQG